MAKKAARAPAKKPAAKKAEVSAKAPAPPAMARAGVITRFWSPSSAPAGRTPGVTSNMSGPRSARMAGASSGDRIRPWTCASCA